MFLHFVVHTFIPNIVLFRILPTFVCNLPFQISRDARDDSGRFSGLLSSSGSPRIFSRSSSRLSFQDDLDVFDFSCPFIVDDVDTSDSQVR